MSANTLFQNRNKTQCFVDQQADYSYNNQLYILKNTEMSN